MISRVVLSVDGNWSEWASLTPCSLECGNGTQVRGRVCSKPRAEYGGKDCEGDTTDLQPCNVHPCPSKSRSLYLYCLNAQHNLIQTFLTLVHGGLTEWSSWTYCNKPCNNGTSDRQRTCTNPAPMYGGNNCSGKMLEWNLCNSHPCSRTFLRKRRFPTLFILYFSVVNSILFSC